MNERTALRTHPNGRFQYLPGIAPYSEVVVASPGHSIIWATFRSPLPLAVGIERAVAVVNARGGHPDSICAMSLRAPSPMSLAEFSSFNDHYRQLLREHNVVVNDPNPVARTNVVPTVSPPLKPALFGFGFAEPSSDRSPSFVVAGAGELREQALDEAAIVRPGDTSPEGMREKSNAVMDAMSRRLAAIGAHWKDVIVVNVYTRENFVPLASDLLGQMGPGAAAGQRWFPSTPPIAGLDFEMDVRATPVDIVVN